MDDIVGPGSPTAPRGLRHTPAIRGSGPWRPAAAGIRVRDSAAQANKEAGQDHEHLHPRRGVLPAGPPSGADGDRRCCGQAARGAGGIPLRPERHDHHRRSPPDRSKKCRDLHDNPHVAFVVDDLVSVDPWRPQGVEIRELHGANGYLIHQFLVHQRQPAYRRLGRRRSKDAIRFAVESRGRRRRDRGPSGRLADLARQPLNDIAEDASRSHLHGAGRRAGAARPLAYLHVMEAEADRELTPSCASGSRPALLNPSTPGAAPARRLALVEDGTADLIAFGGLFLANPDLPPGSPRRPVQQPRPRHLLRRRRARLHRLPRTHRVNDPSTVSTGPKGFWNDQLHR